MRTARNMQGGNEKKMWIRDRLWGLTPKNEELARAYLTGDPADDELLKTAEQQVFSSFTYQTYMDIFELMEKKSAPEQTKILKLLWAIGRSSAVFAVVFEQRYWEIASDSIYRRWCEVLGPAAAAAMEAERAARDTSCLLYTSRQGDEHSRIGR